MLHNKLLHNVQFQKKIHTHPMEGHLKFQGGGGGVLKVKILKAKYEAKLHFLGKQGMQNKKPSVGGVWISSGTAQSPKNKVLLLQLS